MVSVQRVGPVCPRPDDPAADVSAHRGPAQQQLGNGGAVPVTVASPAHDTHPQPQVRTLLDAVDDPAVAAIAPGTCPVPAEVIAGLENANRVLIVAHTRPPPDGDAVGSVLGLGRALRALGKEVDLCIDDGLPGKLRGLDPDGEIKRRHELDDKEYDLAVMVDVGQVERIGDARELVLAAPAVMVIDHHDNEVTRETLGLNEDVPLVSWVQPRSPAAAMQLADVVARLTGGVSAESALPLAAGILTDTGFFKYENVQLSHVQRFKGLLPVLGGDMAVVSDKLKYQLPETVEDLLAVPPRWSARLDRPDAAGVRARARALVESGASTPVTIDGPAAVVTLPAETLDLALAVARLDDPRANENDIIAHVKYSTLVALKEEHPVGVMLVEEEGRVAVETRSREAGIALALAEHLEGGGHPHAAGAGPTGTVAEVLVRIAEWARAWERR